jgi:hypothetical protein
MSRFPRSRGWGLLLVSIGLFFSSNAHAALQKTSFLDATDAPVPTTPTPRNHGMLTPVLSHETQPASSPATNPSASPTNSALPGRDESGGSGLNFGLYDGPGVLVAGDPAPQTVADTTTTPRKAPAGFDPLSPQGLAIGIGSLIVLAGVGWYLSRRRT